MSRSRQPAPKFFIDRSLGRSIAEGLREIGLEVLTMAEVYGEERAQQLADEVWLTEAGANEWIVLTKDDAIQRRPAENRHRILRQASKPGPFIYGVYERRLKRLWPPADRQ